MSYQDAAASPYNQSQVSEKKGQSLTTLQAGRALAAIAVVCFHAHIYFIPERLYPGASVSRIFNFGYAGVEYFFVLSGFIMLLVHRKDIGSPERANRFAKKRIVRILPFYWVVLLSLFALLLSQWPETADRLGIQRLLHSFFLIPMPDGSPLLIGAAWTLTHEFLFYAVFAVLILRPRVGAALFGLWMVGGLAITAGWEAVYPLDTLLSPYNLLFALGMLAALVFRRLPVAAALPMAVLGGLLFLSVGIAEAYRILLLDHAVRTLLFGLGATGLVAGLAALERQGAIAAPRLLDFLGDASFSIYLVHGTVLPVATKALLVLDINKMVPAWTVLTVLVLSSVAVGALAHLYVEKPLIAVLRRRAGV